MSTVPTPLAIAAILFKVDPKHYKVEFENDRVRVYHAYAPHERSVMHGHPERSDLLDRPSLEIHISG